MTITQIIILAFILACLCYLAGLVWIVRRKHWMLRRIEIAKKMGWSTEAIRVKSRYVNTATGRDYQRRISRMMYIAVYEYEINGKKKRVRLTSYNRPPQVSIIYYDAENHNQILNIERNRIAKAVLLLPVIVFVAVTLILRHIFQV